MSRPARSARTPARSLYLSIRSASDSSILASSSSGLAPAQRSKILSRDDHTCVFCGFRSERFQEVRPLSAEGIARPGQTDDWVTSCHMCDQAMSLQRVGMLGEGILIWLPELAQTDLNHLVRALYVARTTDGNASEAARRGIEALKARRDEAKKRLGTDDPLILATVFADFLDEEATAASTDKLEGIRLLSMDRRLQRSSAGEVDRFPDMLTYWRSREGPFGNSQPKDWPNLLAKLPAG